MLAWVFGRPSPSALKFSQEEEKLEGSIFLDLMHFLVSRV